MCQINFDIATTDVDGNAIVAAEGRYRLQGTTPWTTFTPVLGAAQTPDILVTGTYELQVRVQADNLVFSDWTSSSIFYIQDCPDGISPIIKNVSVKAETAGVSYSFTIEGYSNQLVRYQLVTLDFDATATVSPSTSYTLTPLISQTGYLTLDSNGELSTAVSFLASTCNNSTNGTFTLYNDDNLTLSGQVLNFTAFRTC